jgi:hypothetical protein
VANPADLPRVLAAMRQVRSGKIKPVSAGKEWEYKFSGFSFRMKKQLAKINRNGRKGRKGKMRILKIPISVCASRLLR